MEMSEQNTRLHEVFSICPLSCSSFIPLISSSIGVQVNDNSNNYLICDQITSEIKIDFYILSCIPRPHSQTHTNTP